LEIGYIKLIKYSGGASFKVKNRMDFYLQEKIRVSFNDWSYSGGERK
jgi:hypothetical protein